MAVQLHLTTQHLLSPRADMLARPTTSHSSPPSRLAARRPPAVSKHHTLQMHMVKEARAHTLSAVQVQVVGTRQHHRSARAQSLLASHLPVLDTVQHHLSWAVQAQVTVLLHLDSRQSHQRSHQLRPPTAPRLRPLSRRRVHHTRQHLQITRQHHPTSTSLQALRITVPHRRAILPHHPTTVHLHLISRRTRLLRVKACHQPVQSTVQALRTGAQPVLPMPRQPLPNTLQPVPHTHPQAPNSHQRPHALKRHFTVQQNSASHQKKKEDLHFGVWDFLRRCTYTRFRFPVFSTL